MLLSENCLIADMSEEERRLYVEKIDEVEKKIILEESSTQTKLGEAKQVIEDLLKVTEGPAKTIMTRALQIWTEEKALMSYVVGLARDILKLVKSAHGSQPSLIDGVRISQIDKIPFKEMGDYSTVFFDTISRSAEEMKNWRELVGIGGSIGEDLIRHCCNLAKISCDVENKAVTENEWTALSMGNPGGLIGHTHSILCAYDNKARTQYANTFKSTYQLKANDLLNKATTLRKYAADVEGSLLTPAPSLEGMAGDIADHLLRAIKMLQEASAVIRSASEFVRNPAGYEGCNLCIS